MAQTRPSSCEEVTGGRPDLSDCLIPPCFPAKVLKLGEITKNSDGGGTETPKEEQKETTVIK